MAYGRVFLLLVLAAMLLPAQPAVNQTAPRDPVEIVRRSLQRDMADFEASKNYTYRETSEVRRLDKNGKVSKIERETNEVLILAGQPYERLIERDGKPLSEKEAAKETEKLNKELARRERRSASDIAKEDKERAASRRWRDEIPQAFTFRLAGNENVSGQAAWVIDADPKPSYRPKLSRAKMFQKVKARIWIEQSTYRWVKVDAQVLDTLSFGLGMVRIARGGTVHFEQVHVNNEVWLPSAVLVRADARLALLKTLRAEIDVRFSQYQKFQSESRLTDFQELPVGDGGQR